MENPASASTSASTGQTETLHSIAYEKRPESDPEPEQETSPKPDSEPEPDVELEPQPIDPGINAPIFFASEN